jgi:DNA-binding MarR family transcriptional regulator
MPADPVDPFVEVRRQWADHDFEEPLAMVAALSIIRANQLVTTAVDRSLKPLGLTFARFEALVLLSFSKQGSLPMTKMADRLMVHPTGVSKLIDKLEEHGLAERVAVPSDRRVTLARITPAGRALVRKGTKALAAVRYGLDLTDEELQVIIDALARHRAVRAGSA